MSALRRDRELRLRERRGTGDEPCAGPAQIADVDDENERRADSHPRRLRPDAQPLLEATGGACGGVAVGGHRTTEYSGVHFGGEDDWSGQACTGSPASLWYVIGVPLVDSRSVMPLRSVFYINQILARTDTVKERQGCCLQR